MCAQLLLHIGTSAIWGVIEAKLRERNEMEDDKGCCDEKKTQPGWFHLTRDLI